MLDHLHRADDIEKPRLLGQLLDRAHAIGEPRARLLGVMAGSFENRGGGRVDAKHVRDQPRQGLGKQAGPAADVEKIDARQGQSRPALSSLKWRTIKSRAQPSRIGFTR